MRGPQKAIVRSQNGEAQGRVDWKRNEWPDAKFEVRSTICEMSSSERRGKRAEREEGRVDWKRGRWPDAKLEVASAKSDLRKEQQRVKREESRERREKKEDSREG